MVTKLNMTKYDCSRLFCCKNCVIPILCAVTSPRKAVVALNYHARKRNPFVLVCLLTQSLIPVERVPFTN